MQKPSLLADLVDIRHQLGSDQNQDRQHVAHRDREIGRTITRPRGSDVSLLRHWIASIRRQHPAENGVLTQRGVNTLVTVLWLLGLLSGWLLGRAVLHYDGSEPVNIISALVILVISQLLVLVFMVILLAGGFDRIREALLIVNPAVWVSGLAAKLQPKWRARIESILDERGSLTDHGVRRWFLVYLAQHFTVALNLGIVAILLYLVSVSDLAFGWNTTLRVENQSIFEVFRILSLPWEWALPAAVPSADLVDVSRYYRLESTLSGGTVAAAELGTWWVFLLMCILVYGLLPRLIVLVYSGSKLDIAIKAAIRSSAGAGQVISRMQLPLVDSHASGVEHDDDLNTARVPLRSRQSGRLLNCVVLEWSGASANRSSLQQAGIDPQRFYPAGGHQSVKDDRALLDQVASHKPDAVALVVRSWEPPLLDVVDFVHDLREHTGPRCMILIMLLPMESSSSVQARHFETWESQLYQLNDAALYVEALQ